MGFWEDAQPADAGGGLRGIFQNPRSSNIRPALVSRFNGGACFGVALIERPILHPFGNQASATGEPERPLALRPGLATGLPFRGCRGGRPLLRAGPFGKALHKTCRKALAAGKPTRDRPRGRSRRDVRDYVRLCYRNIRSASRGVKSPALIILKLFSSGCV